MGKARYFYLKNALLIGNGISNIIGVSVVSMIHILYEEQIAPEVLDKAAIVDAIFIPLSFLIVMALTIAYEAPIRRYLRYRYLKDDNNADRLLPRARRRLLNEPYYLLLVDFLVWTISAFVYTIFFHILDAFPSTLPRIFITNMITGVITVIIAFFVLERVLQLRLAPYFFPNGGLYMTPGAYRIRIGTRIGALIVACNIVPFCSMITTVWMIGQRGQSDASSFGDLQNIIISNSILFIGVGIWTGVLVAAFLTRSILSISKTLKEVKNGNFDRKVRVTTNDEIGYTGDVINEMTEGLKERDFIKETFGKYVSDEIRDEILSGGVPLDGESKEVTILFADLRDFTPMVESTPPKEVVRIINGYFKEMEEAINANNGLVLQYIGDEIEAVFGAPIHHADHPQSAIRAALEMRDRIVTVNKRLTAQGYKPLTHGIGIHTGEAVAATIGSPDRLSYSLVGDTVNLASRLQGLTKDFGVDIIVSGATGSQVDGAFSLKPLPATEVKGKTGTIEIFALE